MPGFCTLLDHSHKCLGRMGLCLVQTSYTCTKYTVLRLTCCTCTLSGRELPSLQRSQVCSEPGRPTQSVSHHHPDRERFPNLSSGHSMNLDLVDVQTRSQEPNAKHMWTFALQLQMFSKLPGSLCLPASTPNAHACRCSCAACSVRVRETTCGYGLGFGRIENDYTTKDKTKSCLSNLSPSLPVTSC